MPIKTIFALIVVAVLSYFYLTADRRQKHTWMVYFWTAVLAIGAAGLIYNFVTTGTIPEPCCT